MSKILLICMVMFLAMSTNAQDSTVVRIARLQIDPSQVEQYKAILKEEIEAAHLSNKNGVEANILTLAEIQKMEPEVKVTARGGVYFPGDAHLIPQLLVENMIQYLKLNGVNIKPQSAVTDFKTSGSVSQLNAERIISAIKAEMVRKGFKETGSNPDLLVNAMTILKDKQEVTATTNYYGYGGAYRPYGYYGGAGSSGYTTYNTYEYKDGSLIIDIVDAKTNKMIWEGIGNKDIDHAPKNPEEAIRKAVTSIMAGFPPGASK